MPLTLVVEDGTGLVDANTYASLETANAYHSASLYSDHWTDSDEKETALAHATRMIDRDFQFDGYRKTDIQALAWPRIGVVNQERNLSYDDFNLAYLGGLGGRLGRYYFNGIQYPSDVVPLRVVAATCELASEMIKRNRELERPESGVSKLSIGQGAFEIAFDPADRPKIFPDKVTILLRPFGQKMGARSTVPLVR